MKPTLELYPYQIGSCWVFDDIRTQLKEEAFVLGMSEIISQVVNHHNVPNASLGFKMIFSDEPFDGYHAKITKIDGGNEENGNWYYGNICGSDMKGWLCPALYLYFAEAPKEIYMKAEVLPEGVSPIWNPNTNVLTRRFVSAPSVA